MIVASIVILLLIILVFIFMRRPQFGGKALAGERIQQSPHFKKGQFQNLLVTPQLTGGVSIIRVMKEFFFNKAKDNVPPGAVPTTKTDLFRLNPDDNLLVWFGHSSYFMQLHGKKYLVDPVLSGHASPLKFTTRSFRGSDVYSTEDIPPIDYLLITHDHYDHLDHDTVVKLKPKTGKVITGLGVGAHFIRWGYDESIVFEMDWNEEICFEDTRIHSAPARHFSGRSFKRNTSLWLSLVLVTPSHKIFIGGDSGYGTHFSEIGRSLGPFDLAILENGQYNRYWKYIHMMPEEVVQAAEDLKAKKLMPVHWGKFSLSLHSWNEPIIKVTEEAKRKGMPLLHPMIGETVYLDKDNLFKEWWKM